MVGVELSIYSLRLLCNDILLSCRLHPEMVSYLSLKKKDPFAIRASRYQGSQFPEEGLAPVDYASTDAQTSLSIGGTSVQNAGWKLVSNRSNDVELSFFSLTSHCTCRDFLVVCHLLPGVFMSNYFLLIRPTACLTKYSFTLQ